jgi:hypothetical protein
LVGWQGEDVRAGIRERPKRLPAGQPAPARRSGRARS